LTVAAFGGFSRETRRECRKLLPCVLEALLCSFVAVDEDRVGCCVVRECSKGGFFVEPGNSFFGRNAFRSERFAYEASITICEQIEEGEVVPQIHTLLSLGFDR